MGNGTTYNAADLLCFDGDEFVAIAYRALLGRDPDVAGAASFATAVRSGQLGKAETLRRIVESDEARARGTKLIGLDRELRREAFLRGAMNRLGLRGVLSRGRDGWVESTRAALGHARLRGRALATAISLRIDELERATARQSIAIGAAAETGVRVADLAAANRRDIADLWARLGELEANVARLADESRTRLEGASAGQDQLRADLRHVLRSLSVLERRVDVIDPVVGVATPIEVRPIPENRSGNDIRALDRLYVEFEDAFRGDSALLRARLDVYAPHLDSIPERSDARCAVDLGCGRGEFLELLQSKGFEARGVDLNELMVESCIERGLDAVQGDAIAYLRSADAASLDVISAFHVVEHITFDQLVDLLDSARRALRTGGRLILETPNPENLIVGACNFYYDPTHRNPIPPATLQFLARARGFGRTEVLRLHPPETRLEAAGELADFLRPFFNVGLDYALVATAD